MPEERQKPHGRRGMAEESCSPHGSQEAESESKSKRERERAPGRVLGQDAKGPLVTCVLQVGPTF
jgi:hypothetical protein